MCPSPARGVACLLTDGGPSEAVMSQPVSDSLAATIARTEGAILAAPPGEVWPWRFARCWMLATRVEDHGGTVAEIDMAIAEFHRLPGDVPARAKLAAVLVVAQLRRSMLPDYDRVRQAVALADIADADSAPLPAWPRASAALRAGYVSHRMMREGSELSADRALTEIEQYAPVVGDEQPYATMVELARTMALYKRAMDRKDFASLEEAFTALEPARRRHEKDPLLGPHLAILVEYLRVMLSIHRGALPAAEAGLARLTALLADRPPGSPVPASADGMTEALRAGLDVMRSGVAYGARAGAPIGAWGLDTVPDGTVSADTARFYEDAAARPAPAAETPSRLAALGMVNLLRDDAASVDQAIDDLRAAVATCPPGQLDRPRYLMSLGAALGIRFEDRRAPTDLAQAIDALTEARELAGSPASPIWAETCKTLGHLCRLAGRIAEGCAIGLDGLRGHAYSVLLQSDTGGRTNASRDAAEDAIDVARWFLADGDSVGAATALESGRGLILFAATEHSTVADRLVAAGRTDLAERWRAAAQDGEARHAPIDLRRAVLEAFTDRLQPPGQSQVQAALQGLGLDALVYLMPGDNGSGAAVIVRADGATSQIMLPRLHRSHMPDLGGVALIGTRRDARPRGLASLGEVCRWAWEAVVGPLLRKLPDAGGRLPRIALVPMRELAAVPWHAARTVVQGRQVCAVERAVFSYVPSARLLCATAAAAPVRLDDRGLFVGDPDTDGQAPELPAARAEAWAIRERFYPAARYVGRIDGGEVGPDGPGRAKDVLAWLADPAGGSVLHLACHAVVDPAPAVDDPDPGRTTDTAYLLLSDGERLAAERITARRPVGLVVLGACNSGVAARGGYDEAFSLAATFVATGARTVVSSLWSVQDDATSALMFMFHHHLRSGLGPMDALHRAQLWMLTADEQPATDLPERLRSHFDRARASDVDAWAGLIHIGR